MDIFEAVYGRQSVSKVRPDPVPRDLIEKLLSAAAQAPNHFRVRPWRFVVLTGTAREQLGDVMARSLLERKPTSTDSELDAERSRPLRAPVLIAVGVDRPSETRVSEIENVCAAAAAVENMLLAAHALGLGGMWRTGPAAVDPAVKKFLGFEPEQHLIAFVYIGFPAAESSAVDRPSFEDRTIWMA